MVLLHMYEPVLPNRCDFLKPKHWDPPPVGWVMMNVDAALFPKTNRMGLGIVSRNHRGKFLAACRQGFDKITNLELAEAIAFRRAIHFASTSHISSTDQAMCRPKWAMPPPKC